MKTLISLLALALFVTGQNAAFAGESNLEEQAYRELAQFLKVEPTAVRDRRELSATLERVVPIGTIKSEAFQKLRAFLATPPRAIRLDRELERNPGGVSAVFVDGDRGFGIVIALAFDSDGRVTHVRRGEFVH